MDRAAVQAWLDAYVEAWRTYDRDAIAALFSEAASYHYDPWDRGVHGREAIVEDWLREPDAPGTWEASYRPLAVDGDLAVAVGRTRYQEDEARGREPREYANVYSIRFDAEGRCSEFREWYMRRPERQG